MKIRIRINNENTHNIYCNSKVHISLLCFSIFDFKTVFLQLKVGMRFKFLYIMKVIINTVLWAYNSGNCNYFMFLFKGNRSNTLFMT